MNNHGPIRFSIPAAPEGNIALSLPHRMLGLALQRDVIDIKPARRKLTVDQLTQIENIANRRRVAKKEDTTIFGIATTEDTEEEVIFLRLDD